MKQDSIWTKRFLIRSFWLLVYCVLQYNVYIFAKLYIPKGCSETDRKYFLFDSVSWNLFLASYKTTHVRNSFLSISSCLYWRLYQTEK